MVFSFGGDNDSNAPAYLVAYVDDLIITTASFDFLQHGVTGPLGEFAGRRGLAVQIECSLQKYMYIEQSAQF